MKNSVFELKSHLKIDSLHDNEIVPINLRIGHSFLLRFRLFAIFESFLMFFPWNTIIDVFQKTFFVRSVVEKLADDVGGRNEDLEVDFWVKN